jgi:DNA-directed RNA polymerase subunit RPC12/RpoP
VKCSVCQRETSPINIGGENYCSNCGTKYGATTKPVSAKPVAASTRHVTDLSPRLTTPAAQASPPSATPKAKPALPKPAAALHSRAKPAHVLDLRPAAETTATPDTAVAKVSHHLPAAQPKATAHERHLAQFTDRFNRAKQFEKSPQVSRFAADLGQPSAQALATTGLTPAELRPAGATPTSQPATHPAIPAPRPTPVLPATAEPIAARELPHHVATQHQAMADLVRPTATPTPAPAPASKPALPKLKLTPATNRAAAVTAAVAILAGYVWLQNYPKLTLQAASSRAGLTATLPGYIPSSYNLGRTDTAPGLVTLNFTSPSLPDVLKIAQAKTDWDSSSLLDNFVIKATDDYTTVQGQGLTIYLWGTGPAAWVNHGIRYSIEGAARLSREQILKMAYSL